MTSIPSGTAALVNLSTRGPVRSGDNVMIGGFVIQGTGAKNVVVRALGPSLAAAVPGALANPSMELKNASGQTVASSDDWSSANAAQITGYGLAPTNVLDSALVASLAPGSYTAIVRGVNAGEGVGLVEVYDVDPAAIVPAGGTLYLSSLRPPAGVISAAAGSAALQVNAAGTSALLSVDYGNLTSPITSAHLEGPGGVNVFDLSPLVRQLDGTYLWTFAPAGSYSVAQILALLQSGQVTLRVYTSTNPSGELVGSFSASAAGSSFTVPPDPPALPSGPPSDADAARFLSQAAFGATGGPATDPASVQAVMQKGYGTWLNEQFALPASTLLPLQPPLNTDGSAPNKNSAYYGWWKLSVTAPDQLRQRVAYALSQILVVSTESSNLNNQPYAIAAYYDVLLNGAFGNFRTLLEQVTLNPGMGEFLDMLKNKKGTTTTNPNENFAREVLQLFSVGLYQLHPDGTLKLDSRGLPVATYAQDVIKGFARVFTGWTYSNAGTNFNAGPTYPVSVTTPMVIFPAQHEPGSKLLLNGVTLAAVTTATADTANKDLKDALDNIFNHPNVGPFLARQLIQRLVASNPSPAYVYRVAKVFDNNGSGVRGDLRAVVRAILTDYEARTTTNLAFPGAGRLLEPVLRVSKAVRALGGKSVNGTWLVGFLDSTLGQTPLASPTVFNFYAPDYAAQGDIAEAGLVSPEFGITNDSTIVTTASYFRQLAFDGIGGSGNDRVRLDYSPFLADAGSNPGLLVDRLNLMLMSNQMPAPMRDRVVAALNLVNAGTTADLQLERVRTAVYLILASPQFSAQR